MIIKNLRPVYAKHLVCQYIPTFKHLHQAGLSIEEGIHSGLLEKNESQNRRQYTGSSSSLYGNPTSPASESNINNQATQVNTINTQAPQPKRRFTPLGIPMSAVLERLQERGLLKPLDPPRNPPVGADQTKFCAFHQYHGHITNNCPRLRHEIQNLIDDKTIPAPNPQPNVVNNPMPNHNQAQPNINHIQIASSNRFCDPTSLITPINPSRLACTILKNSGGINLISEREKEGDSAVCYGDDNAAKLLIEPKTYPKLK